MTVCFYPGFDAFFDFGVSVCIGILIGFGLAVYSVMESGGTVQYSLVFVGWLEREITITIAAVDVTAEREL